MSETPHDPRREVDDDTVEVLEERGEELPSQRNVNSPDAGRPPRDTEWLRPDKDEEI
jgi:hypothetical protein